MQRPGENDFIAAGLYDEAQADTGRLELLDWLADLGFTIEEMLDANRRLALAAAPGDRRLVSPPLVGANDAASRSGLDIDRFVSISNAVGIGVVEVGPDAPDGEVAWSAEEIEAVAVLADVAAAFTADEAVAFVRVLGNALARIGEAAVSLFLADIEGPHLQSNASELDLARKVFDGVGLLDHLTPHLDPLLRRHVLQAIIRTRETMIGETERQQYRYAVGFVDLVGFTAMSSAMGADALTTFIRDFEGAAFEVAAATGSRVVKLIGDEVMFVATDAGAACRTASALVARFTRDGVGPRGGLAYGDVLLRGGDYYGAVVNLASRLVDEAVPGDVLVDDSLADAASGCTFEPAGRRHVKGFTDPVRVHTLLT